MVNLNIYLLLSVATFKWCMFGWDEEMAFPERFQCQEISNLVSWHQMKTNPLQLIVNLCKQQGNRETVEMIKATHSREVRKKLTFLFYFGQKFCTFFFRIVYSQLSSSGKVVSVLLFFILFAVVGGTLSAICFSYSFIFVYIFFSLVLQQLPFV